MRRQTSTSGINPAGSSRALRLDPLSLPLSFHAQDTRADGGVRQIELHPERVVLRRAIRGMRMAVNVRVSDFLGVALRGIDDAQMLVLVHRDPARAYEIHLMSDLEGFDRSAWKTGFTQYRYAVPALAGYQGRAIYNDVDQIYLADPAELFDLDMRLGEGTGAAIGINLIEVAVKLYREMATFESAGVSDRA